MFFYLTWLASYFTWLLLSSYHQTTTKIWRSKRQEDIKCRFLSRSKTSPLERKTHKNSSLLIESSNDKFQDIWTKTKPPPRQVNLSFDEILFHKVNIDKTFSNTLDFSPSSEFDLLLQDCNFSFYCRNPNWNMWVTYGAFSLFSSSLGQQIILYKFNLQDSISFISFQPPNMNSIFQSLLQWVMP